MKAKFYVRGLLFFLGCGLWGLVHPVMLQSAISLDPSPIPFSSSLEPAEPPKNLVLTETALETLKLSKDLRISKAFLEEKFPGHFITQEYGQGDSPDFYLFTITTEDGDVLFTIKSFLPETYNHEKDTTAFTDLHMDMLEVHSPTIVDAYGIRPGGTINDIVELRGNDLDFGLSHIAQVYMGEGKIFYNIAIPSQVYQSGIFKEKHLDKIKAIAIREDWTVMTISWPEPIWN